MSDKKIYVISAHHISDLTLMRSSSRTFGFYFNMDDAIEAVHYNKGNMHECLYNYLVIEEVGEGIFSDAKVLEWYTWKSGLWVECNCPPSCVGIINLGIG